MAASLMALALLAAACPASETVTPPPVTEVDASTTDTATREAAEPLRSELPGPQENRAHWHSVYGVYSCDERGEGAEKYLPAFQSDRDDTGLHSHGDGLIHIHPFFELSSRENARFEHWFREMSIEVSSERIVVDNEFDPLVTRVAGEECADGTGPAEIRILQWDEPFDPTDPPPPDNVFTEDLGSVRFVADREVFVIAYANATTLADLPAPPADRFEALDEVSSAIEWANSSVDRPLPVQRGVIVPGEEPTFVVDSTIEFEQPTYSAEELADEPTLYDVPPATVTPDGRAVLERLADQLIASGAVVEVRIAGVRPVGSPYSAYEVSLGRAIAVRDLLIELGVPPSQVIPVVYDPSPPGIGDRVDIVLAE